MDHRSLKKIEIEKRVVVIVTDSAKNMIAAANNLNFPRIPCIAHNLNLIVRNSIEKSILTTVDEVTRVVMHLKKKVI